MMLTLLAALSLQTAPGAEAGSDGPFRALALAVPDLEKFDKEWAVPTEGVQVTSTSRLVRNKPTYIVAAIGGCERDAKGNCQIEIRHRLVDPSGKVYDGLDGTKGNPSQDVPVATDNQFHLAPDVLGIRIEPGEALGPYRLTVTMRDLRAKRTVVTSQVLTAVETE